MYIDLNLLKIVLETAKIDTRSHWKTNQTQVTFDNQKLQTFDASPHPPHFKPYL